MITMLVPWTNRLFEALVNGFTPGLLIATLVRAMTQSRARVSAATRFVLLWLALAVVVLLPIAALKPSQSRAVESPSIAAAAITAPPSNPAVEAPTQSAALNPPPASVLPLVRTSQSPELAKPQPSKPLPLALIKATPSQSSVQTFWSHCAIPHWSLAAATLWLVGALVFLFRLGWGYLRLTAWKKTCRPAVGRAAEFFQGCVQKARPGRPVRLGFSTRLQSPVLAGLGSPCILFPESLWEQLGEAEREQVLLHELAHLRRWDDWTNLAEHLVSALFFFHPVVRWLCARLRLEREIACDDWVLASGQPTRQYALCLARLAELATTPAGHCPAPAFWFNRAQLSRRVGVLLDSRRNGKTTPSTGIVAVTAITLLLASLASLAFLPRSAFAAEPPLATENSPRTPTQPEAARNAPDQQSLRTSTAHHPANFKPMDPSQLPDWRSDWVIQMDEASVQAKSEQTMLTTMQAKLDQQPVADWPKLLSPYQTDPESAKLHDDLQAAGQKITMFDAGYTSRGMEDYREAKAALKVIQRQAEEKSQAYVAGVLAKLPPSAAKSGAIEDEIKKARSDALGSVHSPEMELRHHLEFLRMKARADFAYWQAWCAQFDELADAELRKIMPGVLPDNELAGLLSRLHSTEQQVAILEASDLGAKSEAVRMARAAVQSVQKQIDDKVHGMVAAIKIRSKALQAGYDSIARDMSRLDLKKELGGANGRETDAICRFEFYRIDTRAKIVVRQVLYGELTNTPPEALRSIMGAINQDPAEPKQYDRLVEASGKWRYAKQKLAMINVSDVGPTSEEYGQAEAETKTAQRQLDEGIERELAQFGRIADTLQEAEENYVRQLDVLRAYCAKRETDLNPQYIKVRRALLADEINLLQAHLEHDLDATARRQIQTELDQRNQELARIPEDPNKGPGVKP